MPTATPRNATTRRRSPGDPRGRRRETRPDPDPAPPTATEPRAETTPPEQSPPRATGVHVRRRGNAHTAARPVLPRATLREVRHPGIDAARAALSTVTGLLSLCAAAI